LFGAVDVAELSRSGRLMRNWSPIVKAKFAFLDEM
jgi:hypothetical protein